MKVTKVEKVVKVEAIVEIDSWVEFKVYPNGQVVMWRGEEWVEVFEGDFGYDEALEAGRNMLHFNKGI